jgi:hypothetical protein
MIVELHKHPSEEILERYSLKHLSEGESERVEEHLFVCHRCQDELVQVEKFVNQMKTACHAYRLSPDPVRPSILSRLAALVAVPRLAYGGVLAAVLLVFAVPLLQNQAERTAPTLVSLDMTYRGSDTAGVVDVVAQGPIQLAIDIADLPAAAYRLQIVNQNGRILWTGIPSRKGNKLVAETSETLAPGRYWVRLYGSDPDPLREFGLQVN